MVQSGDATVVCRAASIELRASVAREIGLAARYKWRALGSVDVEDDAIRVGGTAASRTFGEDHDGFGGEVAVESPRVAVAFESWKCCEGDSERLGRGWGNGPVTPSAMVRTRSKRSDSTRRRGWTRTVCQGGSSGETILVDHEASRS